MATRWIWLSIVLAACTEAPAELTPDSIVVAGGKADGNGRLPPPHRCASGSQFATNGDTGMFCIFDIDVPAASVTPACEQVDRGAIGYRWPTVDAPYYACPAFARSQRDQDTSACIVDLQAVPTGVGEYCAYVADGYFGYSWSLCPAGGRVEHDGAGAVTCTFDGLALPPAEAHAAAFCEHAAQGYVGFSFVEDAAPGYRCPAPFVDGSTGFGIHVCLLGELAVPATLAVSGDCDIAAGRVGFRWPED